MISTMRAFRCVRTNAICTVLALSFLTLSTTLAYCRSIPTNIPTNRLSAADATYLLEKDRSKVWLGAELQTSQMSKTLASLTPVELAKVKDAPVIARGSDLRKEVAFSFDDGPHPAFTPDLIAILSQYHIPATMFVVGTQAQKYPYLVKDEVAAGLTIGDHTYHHFSLTKIPSQYIGAELEGCSDVVKQITGKAPTLFRPPGGDYSPAVARVAGQLGFTTVLWTVDPGDFNKPAAAVILARTLGKVNNGSILLFHDGIPETMEALPLMIDYLEVNGYKIVSIDQMLRERRLEEEQMLNSLKMAKNPDVRLEMPITHVIDEFNSKE